MTATISQARDEMLEVFRSAWLADPTSAPVPVIYDGVGQQDAPDAPKPYVRIAVRHNPVQPGQVTLPGANGKKRYRRTGFVFVQLFTGLGDGLALSDTLATIVQRAFQGASTTPGDVIFRAVSASEVGRTGGWYQTNVTASFEYDEVV